MNTEETLLLFDHGLDIAERRIYLIGDLTDENSHKVIKSIHHLNSISNKPISLWVKSQGGDLDNMFALYDIIVNSAAPIHTIGFGEVCSGALLVLACGALRSATENCWSMHHQISYSTDGTEMVVETAVAAARRQAENRYKLLAAHSKKKASWWEQKTKDTGDIWWSCDQLLELGIIDTIIKNPRIPQIKATRTKKPKVEKPKVEKSCRITDIPVANLPTS